MNALPPSVHRPPQERSGFRFTGPSLLLAALMASAAARGELIGFYPFDGTDPVQDASGKGARLESASADPTHLPTGGLEGGAYEFDGTQRWVAPINIDPAVLPQVTMGAWVRTSSLVPGLRKILGTDNGGWDRSIGLDDRDGPFRFTSFIGNGTPATGTPGPTSVHQWAFVAVTYDEVTTELAMYVDTDAVTTEPLVPVIVPTGFMGGFDTVAIGGLRPDNAAEAWLGTIDNVFFFDEILTPERMTALRNGGRKAILGQAPDDPDLQVTSAPKLDGLPKVPSAKTLEYPVRNAGTTKALHLARVALAGNDAGYFSVQSFPSELAPGATGVLRIGFDSRGQVGTFEATATLETDDPSTPAVLLDLASRVVPAQTLLGFYAFDDAANPLKDESGGGRNLIGGLDGGNANPTYLPAGGFRGGAYEYQGTHRLVAPININPSVVPRLGMGAWVKTASLEPGLRKVLGHDDGAWDRVIGLDTRTQAGGGELADGTLRYAVFTGGNNHGPSQGDPPPAPISTETWTFLAADYDQANNRVSLYVDLDASTTSDPLEVVTRDTQMSSGVGSVSIGSLSPGGSGEGWIGLIDDVFFVSGGLDEATMRAVRDGGRATLLQFGPDPALAVPSGRVFGTLPNAQAKTVQIRLANGGLARTLDIARVRVTGRDAAAYTVGTVPAEIAPGAGVDVAVTLTPAGREGLLQATLEITSNDSANRRATVDLTADVPFVSLRSALVGFYPFDDAAAPLKDESGNNRTLVTAGFDPIHQPSGGFESGYFSYDGSQRLVAPLNINPSAMPMLTMGAWVRLDNLDPGLKKVMGSDDGGWDRTIGLDNREGAFRFTAFSGNGVPIANTPEPESTEAWTFLAATFDQDAALVTVYVDLDASTKDDPLVAVARPGSTYGPGFNTVSLGSLRPDNANEGFVGGIDNAFFYSTVVSVADLTAIRNGGKSAILSEPIRLLSIRPTASTVALTWRSSPGASYRVEYTESLPGPWVAIATQASQGASTSYTDASADRPRRRTGFYRIAR